MAPWRITYVWVTYIVPHMRYGALIYLPTAEQIRIGQNSIKSKIIEKYTIKQSK